MKQQDVARSSGIALFTLPEGQEAASLNYGVLPAFPTLPTIPQGIYMDRTQRSPEPGPNGMPLAVEADSLGGSESFAQLAGVIPDGILIHQCQRVVYANLAALRLLRAADIDQLLARQVCDVLHSNDLAWHGQADRWDEAQLRRLDGAVFDAELICRPTVWCGEQATQVLFRDISERKQAEAKLKAIEARLNDELDAMNRLHQLGVRLLAARDLGSALEAVLDAAISLLGADFGNIRLYDPERRVLEIVVQRGFPQDFLDAFKVVDADDSTACGRALQCGRRVLIEDVSSDPESTRSRDLAAAAGYRAVQSTPLCTRDLGILGMLSTHFRHPHRPSEHQLRILDLYANQASDVIQRARMEQALRASEDRFRRALQPQNVGVIFFDMEGKIVDANDAFLCMSGYTHDDVLAGRLRWDEMTPPEWMERSRHAIEEIKRKGYTTPYEKEYIRKNGSRWWGLFAGTLLDEKEGVEYVIDITEQKRAERALRESEARFRTLADASPALIWQIDEEGHAVFLNQRHLDVTGLAPDHLLALGWQSILHPDEAPAYLSLIDQALRDRRPFQQRVRVRVKDGAWHWFESHASPWFSVDGKYCGHVGISIDVTEAVRSEEALKIADRRKDEFLATLAHELRNPLAPISSAIQLLKHPEAKTRDSDLVDMVDRQVRHVVRLVDDLMEVSRITRGKIELDRALVPLDEIVANAVETSRPMIEQARHALVVSMPDEPLTLQADMVRLTQVLANLLNNAAKYTNAGGRIWLSARREGDAAVLSVRDNGVGIPVDRLERVFEMFTQVHRSLGRSQGGLGIGLTMARRIVEMHGGTVVAHSEGLGHGSEFVVRLPLSRATCGDLPDEGKATEAATAPLAGKRILIVDDNRDAADALGMLLAANGADARVVYDGRAALAELENVQPHAVVLDIGMPGMDGYAVARQIREDDRFNDTRIIALTGWGQQADRLRSQACGIDRHLTKPVDLDALQALLAED